MSTSKPRVSDQSAPPGLAISARSTLASLGKGSSVQVATTQNLISPKTSVPVRTHELSIAGLPFKLRSSHDEQTVKELVDFVDVKMKQAMNLTKSGSFQSAAVLAALNIAEELILLKRRAQQELDLIEEKAFRISQDLENSKLMKGPQGNA